MMALQRSELDERRLWEVQALGNVKWLFLMAGV